MAASSEFGSNNIERWLANTVGIAPPVTWRQLAGGHSNLTFELEDADGRLFVIRRPPHGVLLPKAHDMEREFRILTALWPTDVPVPEPIAFCADPAIAETNFYVMGKSPGHPLYSGADVTSRLSEPARRHVGESLVDVLAKLHTVEPSDVGLGELGRHSGYVSRQLATWYRSWTSSVALSDYDDPRVHQLHERLVTELPEQQHVRIIHGDYGPHNCLFSHDGVVSAVLDWEITTLGDPLADLGYLLNAWVEPGDGAVSLVGPPSAQPGFVSRDALVSRYADATGFDVANLGYFRIFNAFRSACIRHGVYARYRAGQKSADDVDVDMIFTRMRSALDLAETLSATAGQTHE